MPKTRARAHQPALMATSPSVHRRPPKTSNREIRRTITARTAADAIGPITRGCEIYGLNKGQFSLIDIIEHCLAATGPADVTLSTWTAAGADLTFAHKLLTNGTLRSLRFIVDFSFPTRQPEYCAALRERFGDQAIRITRTHAKFVVIRNADWHVVIRSSMNLNENRRLESFEISDDPGMAAFLLEICDELFTEHAAGAQFDKGPYQNCVDFERLAEPDQAEAEAAALANGKKYFNDGPLVQDIRRAGLSYTKTGKGV